MNFYVDITLLPDDDIPTYFIRNKVYTKLHKALSTLKATDIGVSFPKYRVKLGDVIRIHGAKQRLDGLQAMNWLGGLSGYCEVSDILAVPEKVKYRVVSRIQSNMTEAKLRRLIKRGSITPEEVKQYKAKMFSIGLDNSYLELESNSNGHKHRRYIQFGELSPTASKGEFDQFGLSKTASIPWF